MESNSFRGTVDRLGRPLSQHCPGSSDCHLMAMKGSILQQRLVEHIQYPLIHFDTWATSTFYCLNLLSLYRSTIVGMNLLYRQIWALIRKNWLLICVRRPITTLFRALVLPLVVILVLAYSKNFFSSSRHWGVSSPRDVSTMGVQRNKSPSSQVPSYGLWQKP